MSKNRLDESTIRRFMGLSGLGPLGENFIDRIREEEGVEEPEAELAGEEPAGEEPEMDMGEEPAAVSLDGADAATEMATDVADAVADALSDVLGKHGVEVTSSEAGDEPAMDAEPAMGAEPELDAEPEPELDEMKYRREDDDKKEEDDLEEANIELVDNDALVQEVARRVAARLVREAKSKTD